MPIGSLFCLPPLLLLLVFRSDEPSRTPPTLRRPPALETNLDTIANGRAIPRMSITPETAPEAPRYRAPDRPRLVLLE